MLVGVPDRAWIEPFAQVLDALGTECAWIVHGADGMDELSTTGASFVTELKRGDIRSFEVSPGDVGLQTTTLDDLRGGDAEANAAAIHALLDGAPGPFRDIAIYTAAAALIVAGKAEDLKQGAAIAADAVDGGGARAALDKMVAITNEGGGA